MNEAVLEIIIKANNKQAKTALKGVSKSIGNLGKKFKNFSKSALAGAKKIAKGLTIMGAAAAAGAFVAIRAWNKQERANVQLETLVKNVKGATDEHVQSLKDQAAALQRVGVVGDEVTMMGQAQLATFALQADTIKTLTPSLLDMAVQIKGVNVTQEDMVTIGNLVGKVMSGQVGALSRYGVSLSDAQKEQLELGDEMERATVLAEVLAQNFGGVNEAIGNTFAGKVAKAKNNFGDFMELIGKGISSRIEPLVDAFNDWIEAAGGVEGILKRLNIAWDRAFEFWLEAKRVIVDVANQIGDHLMPKFRKLIDAIKDEIIPALKDSMPMFRELAIITATVVVVAIGLFIDALRILVENFDVLLPVLAAFGAIMLGAKVLGAIATVTAALVGVGGLSASVSSVGALVGSPAILNPWALLAIAGVGAASLIISKFNETADVIADVTQKISDNAASVAIAASTIKKQFDDAKITKLRMNTLLEDIAVGRGEIEAAKGEIFSIKNILKDFFLPGNRKFKDIFKADGGPVSSNTPFIVGERGPEVFVPSSSGTIIPNGGGNQSGGAGQVININNTNTFFRDTDPLAFARLQAFELSRR